MTAVPGSLLLRLFSACLKEDLQCAEPSRRAAVGLAGLTHLLVPSRSGLGEVGPGTATGVDENGNDCRTGVASEHVPAGVHDETAS